MPTGTTGSACSSVSHVPGMNRLNVDAQSVVPAWATAGTVNSVQLPPTIVVTINAAVRRDLECRTGMDTSDGRKDMCAPTFTHTPDFPNTVNRVPKPRFAP